MKYRYNEERNWYEVHHNGEWHDLESVEGELNRLHQELTGASYGWPPNMNFLSTAHACAYFHEREMRWESQVAGLKARIAKLTEATRPNHEPPVQNQAPETPAGCPRASR